MNKRMANPVEISSYKTFPLKYSVCTLVSNKKEYEEMVESFIRAGFNDQNTEFLYADNSNGNKYEAFGAINKFLRHAIGKYIILVHQDVLLNFDNEDVLDQRLRELDVLDKRWAIVGNAGGIHIRNIVMKITEGTGRFHHVGNLPAKVATLDENFLVVKNEANLAISSDLHGFHMYGADICLLAKVLGYTSYVIEFHLLHKSSGNPDKNFYRLKDAFMEKYQNVFSGTYLETTITRFYLSGSRLKNIIMNSNLVLYFVFHLNRPKGKPWKIRKKLWAILLLRKYRG